MRIDPRTEKVVGHFEEYAPIGAYACKGTSFRSQQNHSNPAADEQWPTTIPRLLPVGRTLGKYKVIAFKSYEVV